MGRVKLPDQLTCPGCGSTYLHHVRVDVFDRKEDAEQVRRTRVDEAVSVLTLPNETSGNPSSRRDALAVRFECEECGSPSTLSIAQHKGETHLYFYPASRSIDR